MSHFTTVQTQIKDIEALKKACEEMGLTVVDEGEARGYGNRLTHGDHVIRLNGPYDIAVNKQKDGTYGLTTDWWDGHVEQEVGTNYGHLIQMYGVCKATAEARRRGHMVQRRNMADGSIKLCIGGV